MKQFGKAGHTGAIFGRHGRIKLPSSFDVDFLVFVFLGRRPTLLGGPHMQFFPLSLGEQRSSWFPLCWQYFNHHCKSVKPVSSLEAPWKSPVFFGSKEIARDYIRQKSANSVTTSGLWKNNPSMPLKPSMRWTISRPGSKLGSHFPNYASSRGLQTNNCFYRK